MLLGANDTMICLKFARHMGQREHKHTTVASGQNQPWHNHISYQISGLRPDYTERRDRFGGAFPRNFLVLTLRASIIAEQDFHS